MIYFVFRCIVVFNTKSDEKNCVDNNLVRSHSLHFLLRQTSIIGKYPFWYERVDDPAPTLTATGENLNTSPMRSNALPYARCYCRTINILKRLDVRRQSCQVVPIAGVC